MANVLATYTILLVIFGAFLEASGAQRFFIDFPLAAVGHKIGGPAMGYSIVLAEGAEEGTVPQITYKILSYTRSP